MSQLRVLLFANNKHFLEQLLRTRFSVIIVTDLRRMDSPIKAFECATLSPCMSMRNHDRNNSSAWEGNNHQLDDYFRMILIIRTIDSTRHSWVGSRLDRRQIGCILHRDIRCTLIRTSHCDVGVVSSES